MDGKGIGGHQRTREGLTSDWLTPPGIIEELGPFDLDPCASEDQPWLTAASSYSPPKDGLALPWHGRIWLNPPYGPETWKWLAKLADHPEGGIALIFARTETRGFFREVWNKADSLFFIEGRLHFHYPINGERAVGNAGGPSVLAAYGGPANYVLWNLQSSELIGGRYVRLQT